MVMLVSSDSIESDVIVSNGRIESDASGEWRYY